VKYIRFFNKENILVIVSTFYIFFWDLFLTLGIKFDIRIITLVLSFFLIEKIIKDLKKENYTFFYLTFIIFLFLTLHSFFIGNILNTNFFLSTFFLLYIFGIAYYFGYTILANKEKIIYLFILLFLISILIHYVIGFSSNPEPFSCGGLKNLFWDKKYFDKPIFLIHFISSYSLVFNENSHLAMSGVAVLIYSFYLISKGVEKKISIFILVIFIIILFLKSSGTLLAGTVFSILAVIISEYKRLNKYSIFSFVILLIVLLTVFVTDKVCLNKIALDRDNIKQLEKFNPLSQKNLVENLLLQSDNLINEDNKIDLALKEDLEKKIEKLLSNKSFSNEIKLELNIIKETMKNFENKNFNENIVSKINTSKLKIIKTRDKELNVKGNYRGSLSSEVFFHALKVTYDSILIKPFGWGFQGYEHAFKNYNQTHNVIKKSLETYNNKDASNNTFKIITEFGIFGLIIFLSLLYISLNNKISLDNKIFLIPFLVTQLIRGAGYFNGGFILIMFLLIILHFKNINKESRK